jgi:hypothetical protein
MNIKVEKGLEARFQKLFSFQWQTCLIFNFHLRDDNFNFCHTMLPKLNYPLPLKKICPEINSRL